ncbi:MAG: ribosomal protein S18-alanine N-acetyltransferase [Candidatus Aramenus sp.]|nr:ribosomal protein S18-alanine N-acetyltransferase [Candidatus Aramenus sp.]
MVIISDATEEDLGEIYRIELESFDNPYPLSLLKAYLYLASVYVVAKEDGQVVGYAIGIIQHRVRGHVVSIATAQGYRKKGVGSALLRSLEEAFKQRGCTYSYLEVKVDNEDAVRFYSKNGYFVTFTRKNYYGRGKHAFVMVKPFIDKNLE